MALTHRLAGGSELATGEQGIGGGAVKGTPKDRGWEVGLEGWEGDRRKKTD